MTTNGLSNHNITDALDLLHKAHQQLLDSSSYGADVLVYRAILCLSAASQPPPRNPMAVWQPQQIYQAQPLLPQ